MKSLAATMQTASPAFRAWFGASAVVDAEGRPRVVYHGTNADFDVFDPARAGQGASGGEWLHTVEGVAWFSDSPVVASYFADKAGGRVLPVYLRIQRPFMVDAEAWAARFYTRDDYFRLHDGPGGRVFHIHRFKRRAIEDALLSFGDHDGVIFTGGYDGPPVKGNIYAVGDPAAIKSAIGNRGTWSPTSPSILHGLDEDVATVEAWHGTPQTVPFRRFDPNAGRSFGGPFNRMGSWFAGTREAAALYARPAPGQPPGRLYKVRIALREPWVLDYRDGVAFDQIANYIGHAAGRHGLGRKDIVRLTPSDVAAFRERLGPRRSAVVLRGFREGPGMPESTVYVVFDPSDVKILSSEPVTR